jgi:hypothetical protein
MYFSTLGSRAQGLTNWMNKYKYYGKHIVLGGVINTAPGCAILMRGELKKPIEAFLYHESRDNQKI